MDRKNVTSGILIVGLLASLAAVMPSRATAKDAWQGQVTLYGWGAGVGGDLTPLTAAPTLSFEKSLSDVLEDLDAAFFVTGFARKGDFVVLGDFSYSAVSKGGLVPPGVPASGEMTQTSLTLAAGRRVVASRDMTMDLLAGARAWWVDGAVSVPLAGISVSPSNSFIDPIVAMRVNSRLSERWSLLGYFDVGGFGVGSDLTWQAVIAANYQVSDTLYLSAGYRHLYLDYADGGTSFEGYMSGPLIGATWRF